MPRIGRGIQPQGIDSQGPIIGPFKPTALAPVVTTLNVNLATGLLTNQRRAQQRRPRPLGLEPPQGIQSPANPLTPGVFRVAVKTFAAQSRRQTEARRFPLQGWEGWGAIDTLSGPNAKQLGGSLLGDYTSLFFFGTTSVEKRAISFVALAHELTRIDAYVAVLGAPTDNLLCEIQTDSGGSPSGVILASQSVPGSSLAPLNGSPATSFAGLGLTPGATYWIVLHRSGAADDSNFYGWVRGTGSSTEFGGSWAATGGVIADVVFEMPPGSRSFYGVKRNLGPSPPLVILPLPSQPQQTVGVHALTQSVVRRQTERDRFPLQGWAGDGHLVTASPVGVGALLYRGGWFRDTTNHAFGSATNQQIALPLLVPWNTSSFVLAVALTKQNAPTDNAVISIQGNSDGIPDGNILASFSVAPASMTAGKLREFTASFAVPLLIGEKYWIVFSRDGALDNTNLYGGGEVSGLTQVTLQPANALYSDIVFGGSAWSRTAILGYWKVTPLDGNNTGTPLLRRNLGPKPPEYTITVLPVPVAPIQVNLATGILVNQRRYEQRRPHSFLFVVQQLAQPPPVVTTVTVTTFGAQSRRQTEARRFPLPGSDETIVFVTASNNFPFNGLIDTFTADTGSGSLATRDPNWPVLTANPSLHYGDVFPNTIDAPTGGVAQNYWLPQQFGPDCEAYVTLVQLDTTAGRAVKVAARIQNPTSTTIASFYYAKIDAQLNTATLEKVVNNATSTLVSTSLTVAAGDKIGLQCVGSTIRFWWYDSTGTKSWRKVLETQDTSVTSAGYIGMRSSSSVSTILWVIDDFGGGTIPSPDLIVLTRRRLGPFPPIVIGPVFVAPEISEPSLTSMQAVAARVARQQRAPHSDLFGFIPQVSAQPPPPISVNLQDNRVRGFGRRHFPSVALNPPTVLQTFAGPRVTLAHTRPRPFSARYITPATLEPEAVFLAERQPRILLVRTRPRRTLGSKLSYVAYPQTTEITVALVRTRPRPVIRSLTAVSYPQTGVGFTHLVRTRPRPTSKFLAPPSTLQPYAVTVAEDTVRVAVVRTRPRPTTRRVLPPTVLQVFTGPVTPLVRTRPRPTQHRLTAITYPAASTIRVTLARTRPRPTSRTLGPLVFYAQTSEITATLVRTRPRHTVGTVRPPAITAVAQAFYGPTVLVARTRPRHVASKLAPPVFYAATSEITVAVVRTRPLPTRHLLTSITYPQTGVGFQHLVRTRPRPTTRFLLPPSTLQPYSVTVAEDTIRVTLTRTRPRPTTRRLAPPTVLQTFAAPRTPLVRIRPRHTVAFVAPPATLEPEAVSLAEREIRVVLTRTRPRHTVGTRLSYTVYPQTSKIAAALARTRPRPTVHRLTAVSYPATSEIAVVLTRTRPRPTTRRLSPPIFYAATSEITAALTRTRPRPTTRFLAPPTTLQTFGPPVEVEIAVRVPADDRARRKARSFQIQPVTNAATSEIAVTLARTRPRPTRSFLTAVTYPATSEVTVALVRARSRPLTRFVAPPATLQPYSVTIAEDTVRVTAVRTRPRHTLGTKLNPPTALRTFAGPAVTLTHTRPRPTLRRLAPPTVIRVPSVEQREDTITVALVHTRPRPTEKFLIPPVVRTFPPVVTTLLPAHVVKTRPRPTTRFLRPPTVVIPLPTLRMQTITAATVRTRPRPTRHSLTPLAFYKQTSKIQVVLARTRPRPTTKRLSPPIFYKQTSEIQVVLVRARPRPTTRTLTAIRYEQTSEVTVALARIRPRPTRHFVAPPTVLQTFGPPVEVEIAVRTPLEDRARRRPRSFAIQPVVVAATSEISVTFTRTRPRPTSRRLTPATALSTFQGPTLALARIRPRRTVYAIRPPATLEPESVAIAEREERVTLARTRPRPTRSILRQPTAVRAFVAAPATVTLVHTRPRRTNSFLFPPTAVRTFVAAPILVALVASRPRTTITRLAPPTRLRAVETTIRVSLARIRPRRVHPIIPSVLVEAEPPVVTAITVALARTRPRLTRSILRPPATLRRVVVAFIAPPIQVATVTIRPPRTHVFRVTPFPFFRGRDGFTTSTVIPSAMGTDSSIVATGGASSAVVGDSADSAVVATTGGDIEDTLADGGEILDRPGGLT